MEALRDLALAEYENEEDEYKKQLHDQFKQMVADGSDFSKYFGNRTIPAQRVPDMMAVWLSGRQLYRKKRLDFEEFITLTYIDSNPEAVILCKGCSSLITGRPYFLCNDCFNDHSNGQSFNLCCDCYRSRNFKGHQHQSFFANHLLQHGNKPQRQRPRQVDRAIMEFSKDFIKFARSIATDNEWENRFGELLNITEKDEKVDEISRRNMKESHREKSGEEKEKNSSMSRPNARGSRNIDLLGMVSSGLEE